MISTRFIMTSSGACLAVAGLALLFFPAEALSLLGLPDGSPLVAQVFSALLLGSAAANWTARGSMIGGIYARPLALANYLHFFMGSLILVMGLDEIDAGIGYFAVLCVYCVFGVMFAWLLFRGPGTGQAGQ